MTDQLQGLLASAYELIEADQLAEARSLLKPILAENPDSADAWWLYAHAVEDPETARTALNNVLRIDRDYPSAAGLMTTLEQTYPTGAPAPAAEPLAEHDLFALDAPDSLDLADELEEDNLLLDTESDFDEDRGDTAPVQVETVRRRTNWPLILLLILLIAVIIALLLLSRGGGNDVQPPALVPTSEVTAPAEDSQGQVAPTSELAVSAESTEESTVAALAESVLADAAALAESALADAAALPGSARVESTPLGQTMLVSVCTAAGDEMRAALAASMANLSTVAGQMGAAADAIGVRLVSCDTEQILRVIGVPAGTAAQYAEGALDLRDYQASWSALP